MKNLLFLWLLTGLMSYCDAQTLTMDKVPAACSQAFKQKFPNGFQPGWKKAAPDVYEVMFFNGKKRQSALFDNTGKWLQTQSEINFGQMPMKVQNAFMKDFEEYNVQEVYETEIFDKGICYEITAFKTGASFVALFSAKGELLKKEDGESYE